MSIKKLLLAIVFTFLAGYIPAQLYAQVSSNKTTTRVGNPTQQTGSNGAFVACPIPGGTVSCGPYKPSGTCSKYGCAHCDPSCYSVGSWCSSDIGSHYAADIPGAGNQDTILPSITYPSGEAHSITCRLFGVGEGTSTPGQKILIFSCRDDVTLDSISIQFHHMSPNAVPDSNREYKTGDVIGKLDPRDGPHAHVQIGINGGCGSTGTEGCVPADQYLQCT